MSSALTKHGVLDVPTIDITVYRDGSSDQAARAQVAQAVDRAARTVGFMQIVGHGIPAAVLDDFTTATDAFFALDSDIKAAYRAPAGINRGYTPPKSERLANSLGLTSAADLFEALNIGTTTADYPGLDLLGSDYAPNDFPSEVPGFERDVTAWFTAAGSVARTMIDIFADALRLPSGYFTPYTDHSLDVLRMINYRMPDADAALEPEQVGMGAHTDYGIVTVLWADPVPGLEILGNDRVWHPVQPATGALLVNLGDAIARWTNNNWISTMHRVAAPRVNGKLVPRRSAAYFHDGNTDAVIAPLPSCTSDTNPPRYAPTTIGEHLAAKLAGSRDGKLNPNAQHDAARLQPVSARG